MRSIAVVIAVLLPAVASAQDARPTRADVDAAIGRGLGFLAKDALAWKAEHNCASCHHASLVIVAMREAKQYGHAVEEPVLADLTKWIAESGNGKFDGERPAAAPYAASPKAIYFALALGADPRPDEASQKGLKLLLKTVAAEQTENGSWSLWPETRPPIPGSSDESLTALATLALLPAAATGDEAAKAARDRAIRWLADTKTDDDPQSVALRLILWTRLGRPGGEAEPLVRRIKDRQNTDGGWSQAKGMASDAWATGQALFALAQAGIKSDDAVIAHGHGFLVKTQREDGSWAMTSRPTTPGGKGSKSLIPITGAGSAWAVLGLVRSTGLAETTEIKPIAPPMEMVGKWQLEVTDGKTTRKSVYRVMKDGRVEVDSRLETPERTTTDLVKRVVVKAEKDRVTITDLSHTGAEGIEDVLPPGRQRTRTYQVRVEGAELRLAEVGADGKAAAKPTVLRRVKE